jgi:TrmH family RNA methyltransferase
MAFPSPSNRQITDWRKLLQGKYRKRENKFIAEGLRCVEQIIHQKRIKIEAVVVEKEFHLDDAFINSGLPFFEVDSDEFNSLSDTDTPQGVLAICHSPLEAALEKLVQSDGLLVAVDAIQDPGNLGTMIRTASWFNVTGLLIGHGTVDPFHPKVVRSTAGATGALPYLKSDLSVTLPTFEASGWNIAALDGGSESVSLSNSEPSKKEILIIGNEGNGVNPQLMEGRKSIRIEGNTENVESLNAAVALSIALYHFSR